MNRLGLQRSIVVALCVLLVGCTGPGGSGASGGGPAGEPKVQGPKRITMLIKVEPTIIAGELGSSGGGNVMGAAQLNELVHSGLSVLNAEGQRVPQLASAIPTVENGLWMWPQFINSNPPILGASAQFRRAMYQALDRPTTLAAQAMKIYMDNVAVMTLWDQLESEIMLRKDIINVSSTRPAWNLHEWDLA